MNNSNSLLVGAATAAQALGMGKSSLYRLAQAGRIPSYFAGPNCHGVRFDVEEVKLALRRPVLVDNDQEQEGVKGV